MQYFKILLVAAYAIFMSACGSGSSGGNSQGQSGNYSINVIPEEVTLTIEQDAIATVDVPVQYSGDGVIVGMPEGIQLPNWLYVNGGAQTASPITVTLNIDTFGLELGKYRTTLRFLSGEQNGNVIVSDDLPINITVVPQKRALYIDAYELSYTAYEYEAAQSWQLTVDGGEAGKAWNLTIDYPQGEAEGWLDLSKTEGTQGARVTGIVASVKPLPNGVYTADVKLQDDNGGVIASIPVYYNVKYQAKVSISNRYFTIDKNTITDDLAFTLTIDPANIVDGENSVWQLTNSTSWLLADVNSGNFGAIQEVQFSIDAAALLVGNDGYNQAELTITSDNGEIPSDYRWIINVDLKVDPQLAFGDPTATAFNEHSIDLTGSVSVSLSEGEQLGLSTDWQAISKTPWLQLVSSEGSTLQNNTIDYQIDLNQLTSADPEQTAYIHITPTDDRFNAAIVQIPFTVMIPQITHITPQVAYEGIAADVAISGRGFISGKEYSLLVQGQKVLANAISDTILKVQLPNTLQAEITSITIDSTLAVGDVAIDINVKPQPIWLASRTVLDNAFDKISLDPVRNALYFTGFETDQLQRLNYSADSHWVSKTFNLSGLQSIELLANSEQLVALFSPFNSEPYAAYLDPITLQQSRRQELGDWVLALSSNTPQPFLVLPLVNNITLAIPYDGLSLLYHLEVESILDEYNYFTFNLRGVFSRDRTRAFISSDTNSRDSYIVDASTASVTSNAFSPVPFAVRQLGFSASGSKLIVKNQILDDQLQSLGRLTPEQEIESVAVTPSGKQAYAQHYENGKAVIYRHDISGDQAREQYPADALPLTNHIMADESIEQMMVSEDGGALFVLCYSKEDAISIFYVIPLGGSGS